MNKKNLYAILMAGIMLVTIFSAISVNASPNTPVSSDQPISSGNNGIPISAANNIAQSTTNTAGAGYGSITVICEAEGSGHTIEQACFFSISCKDMNTGNIRHGISGISGIAYFSLLPCNHNYTVYYTNYPWISATVNNLRGSAYATIILPDIPYASTSPSPSSPLSRDIVTKPANPTVTGLVAIN